MRSAKPGRNAALGWLAPLIVAVLVLGGWELWVRTAGIPVYILPAPSAIATSLWRDWDMLSDALWVTVQVTIAAFVAAALGGGALAMLFARSPVLERSLYPYAVVLQVTPIVAIAPLIILWVKDAFTALLVCAWIVAFFPVLANTTLGLRSTDHGLIDLFRLYRASPRQTLWLLRVPAALPYFLAGLRIAGGLALIGAVVAEFVAGVGGSNTGLAYRILEAGYRLQVPRMFAALLLISLTGIVIFAALGLVQHLALRRWHESARSRG